MAGRIAGKLLSGLVIGAAVGATVALVLSSRTGVALPHPALGDGAQDKPIPFEPANRAYLKARALVDEVVTQVRSAVEEGKATANQTRNELNVRFEQAKYGKRLDKNQ